MEKDTRLINIYLKIHNKKPLIMDDLRYLAEFAPECFEKTCKNVVYNIPEAKPIMEPRGVLPAPEKPAPEAEAVSAETTAAEASAPASLSEEQSIAHILHNLKRMEAKDFPVDSVDAEKVKELLGSLYMELLFPHNDKDAFFDMAQNSYKSVFDKKM